ncbi:transporter [Streptomyces iconiensis]|uniref:Transporter n=1 Tax=Streptomyces iconiensis TaxID=1384038 RepID=A0ABT6ZYC1_9ACTN|nr:transporter [Streptomyces iconiensis]MDJ1134054.1 transporter [Streptomyces iconiensis]
MTVPSATPHAAPTAVTSTFVRLKLALLRNGLRQSTGRTFFFVTSVVLALLMGALQLLGLLLLRGHEQASAVAVTLSSVLALGWAVAPLFFPGGDETLDPARLVMLPLRPRGLVAALLTASLVGIGPLFTLVLAIGAVASLAHGAAGWVAAVLALPLLVLVCVTLARAVAAANVRLLNSRKGRDLALLSGLLIALGAQFFNLGAQKLSQPGGLSALEPVARVLNWLPPASAVHAVRAASEGSYAVAVLQLALAGAALAALLWWWQHTLTRLMTSPDASTFQAATGPEKRRGTRRGPASLLPEGRTGAVILRTLRYAWRDPKTKVGWASSLGIGLLLPVVLALQGTGSPYNACWAAGLLGLQMYNQFGQDYSAFWLVASTVSTVRDAYVELRARLLAVALVAVPYVSAVVLLSVVLLDAWGMFAEVLGISVALLGALLATGTMASVFFPYSIPQDDGRRNIAPGQGSIAYVSLLGGMVCGGLLSAPMIALAVWLHMSGGQTWVLLPVGAVYALALPALTLRLAARRTAARLPEILVAVSRG